ncbi:hypothetical protein ACSXEH_07155 [Clostridium perfringens]
MQNKSFKIAEMINYKNVTLRLKYSKYFNCRMRLERVCEGEWCNKRILVKGKKILHKNTVKNAKRKYLKNKIARIIGRE